jgi:hypothetical protein
MTTHIGFACVEDTLETSLDLLLGSDDRKIRYKNFISSSSQSIPGNSYGSKEQKLTDTTSLLGLLTIIFFFFLKTSSISLY